MVKTEWKRWILDENNCFLARLMYAILEVLFMKEVKISLQDIESMESFTKTVSEFDYNIYLRPEGDRKETQLNAKSILGVMSLVFYKKLELIAQTDDMTELLQKIQPYLAEA